MQNWNDGKSQEYQDRKTYQVSGAAQPHAAAPAKEMKEAAPVSGKADRYTLFVTATCPNCRTVKPLLQKAGVPYEEKDAAQYAEEAKALGLRQAPTLVAWGEEPTLYVGAAQIKAFLPGVCTMIELAVIGGGPAGLTAALYAARAGRSVAVFEGSGFGGQITLSPLVENYPGLGAVSGMELGDRMYAQAEAAGAELTFSGVQRIERNTGGTFLLETEDGPVSARAVIYAAGAKPRTLGLR